MALFRSHIHLTPRLPYLARGINLYKPVSIAEVSFSKYTDRLILLHRIHSPLSKESLLIINLVTYYYVTFVTARAIQAGVEAYGSAYGRLKGSIP